MIGDVESRDHMSGHQTVSPPKDALKEPSQALRLLDVPQRPQHAIVLHFSRLRPQHDSHGYPHYAYANPKYYGGLQVNNGLRRVRLATDDDRKITLMSRARASIVPKDTRSAAVTWNRILTRSSGATQVLPMPPATPPASSSSRSQH